MADTLPAVRKLLGMEVAFVSEFSEGRRVFRHVDCEPGFTPIATGQSDPLEDSYCQRVVDGRLPELMQDATQNAEAMTLPATSALPVGAHISVPIQFKSGRVFGTFCCFSREADYTLGPRDLAMMRLFGEFVGKVLEEREAAHREADDTTRRLRDVLDHGKYAMVFQPIFTLRDNHVIGFEALARFQADPYRPPNEWIDDATRVGLLGEVEQALHACALGQLGQLPAGTYVAINVAPATILSGALDDALRGQPLTRVVVEITEHEMVSNYDSLAEALGPLRQRGVRLAVDDAGAGYASFRHILQLKPDIIKLDSSLIRDIDTDVARRTLAAALVQFAKQVGSAVVAEGVETQEELRVLTELSVDSVQGYLLGRPKPASELVH